MKSYAFTIAVWWVTCLLWSSSFLFIKIGLSSIPPFTFASGRLILAAIVLGSVATMRGGWSLMRRDLAPVFLSGALLLGVNYGLTFWGAQFIPSGLTALLQAMTPLFALLFGWLARSESVSVAKLSGMFAAVVGVAFVVGSAADVGRASALGCIAVLCGAACLALGYVIVKTRRGRLRPVDVTTVQSVAGLVVLAPAAMLIEGVHAPANWPLQAWVALLYLAIGGSVLAFWLNYWLLQRLEASAMLMMGVAEVPIAMLLGSIVLGERLASRSFAGAVLVLFGVILVLFGGRSTTSPV